MCFGSFGDDPVFDITIPIKIQVYLLAGKPILMAVRGESGTLVSAAGVGRVVSSENAIAMAEAMWALASKNADELQAIGQRGFDLY